MNDQQKIEQSNYLDVMRSDAGRRVIEDILEITGIDSDTWDENPLIQSQLNGKRQVGLRLVRKLKQYCPELYITLMKEKVDK